MLLETLWTCLWLILAGWAILHASKSVSVGEIDFYGEFYVRRSEHPILFKSAIYFQYVLGVSFFASFLARVI